MEVALVDPTNNTLLKLNFNNVCPVSEILLQKWSLGIHCKKFGDS